MPPFILADNIKDVPARDFDNCRSNFQGSQRVVYIVCNAKKNINCIDYEAAL